MNIHVLTVPNHEIKKRHEFTGADWWWDNDETLQVRVAAELTDWRERAALILHEVAEALMCKFLGITVAMVDDFDETQQQNELHGLNAGDEPHCPYAIPHTFATAIERIFAGVVGIRWKEYDARLAAL